MRMRDQDRQDMQRLLLAGYKRRREALYVLLRVTDRERAKTCLRSALPRVGTSHADERRDDERAPAGGEKLALAFTQRGLAALGVDAETLATFVPEFRQGMTGPHRARVLGDVRGDPQTAYGGWRWGQPGNEVHVLYAVFALERAALGWPALGQLLEGAGLEVVDHVFARLEDREPFGFRDGLSQPVIADSGTSKDTPEAVDRIRPGEFILGYLNEFGQYPASPSVAAARDPRNLLPALPAFHRKDLGRNGSFLVVRELEQDVAAFDALGDEEIKARVVGRTKDGQPLVLRMQQQGAGCGPAPDAERETESVVGEFSYHAQDPAGLRCPLGAHIRRANPRDALADEALGLTPERAVALANQHRILRRSRVFRRDDGSTGLMFLCFNTNIERQFEFVQQTWIHNEKFAGLPDEADPLVSNHLLDAPAFTLDCGPWRKQVALGDYVATRGGAYFFMPGLRALRWLFDA